MQALPHRYRVTALAGAEDEVTVGSPGLESLRTAPPVEYDGPGNRWSPETLLVAAALDCFVLTFRGIARASKLSWSALQCDAEGVLDRVEGTTRFTEIRIRARLTVPPGTHASLAERLLEKAERSCLVTNSLTAARHLEASVVVGG